MKKLFSATILLLALCFASVTASADTFTLVMLGTGLAGVAARVCRRRKSAAA